MVEPVQEPLEAALADSLLEPDYLVARTESGSVEALQLDLSPARAADQRRTPNPRGGFSGEGVLAPTPNNTSQLPVRRLQVRG